jgi:hypothetical protein
LYRRRAHKSHFNEGDTTRMPLIVFGDGLKGKAHVRFRKRRVGVSEIIYKNLKNRERQGQLLLLDINEFRTSSVSIFTNFYLSPVTLLICPY